jgi:hypothetical protein
MQVEQTLRTRASRIGLLALFAVPLAAPAAVFGERLAPPRWESVASGNSRSVQIVSNRVVGLYPGATKGMILTLRNPNRNRSISIRGIRVRDVATSRRGCAPSVRNLQIRQYAGPAIHVPAGGTRNVKVLLAMPNTAVDACQRATFRLRYSLQAGK